MQYANDIHVHAKTIHGYTHGLLYNIKRISTNYQGKLLSLHDICNRIYCKTTHIKGKQVSSVCISVTVTFAKN